MTKQRNDSHGTPFSLWLREQKELDSKLGFVATNIDFVWKNYKTGQWMFLEEKCRNAPIPDFQYHIYKEIHEHFIACKSAESFLFYRGFHVLKFSIECPDDGSVIRLDHKIITVSQLIKFLKFDAPESIYTKTMFDNV